MAYKHITSGTVQADSGYIAKAVLMVNKTVSGTFTIYDATGSDTTNVVAIITDPTVGSRFEYWDFQVGVKVVASATSDATINTSSTYGPK